MIQGIGQRLFELTDDEVCAANNLATVGFDSTHDELKRRRFAGAIATDKTNSFTGLDRESGVGKNLLVAEFQRYFIEAQ